METGKLLRELRHYLKISVRDFSAKLGVVPTTIYWYENGGTLTESHIEDICQAFNVDKEYFKGTMTLEDAVDYSGYNHQRVERIRDTILTIPSDISIAEFLRDVKGLSARYTFKKYPDLKNHCWKGKLWNGQSMVETIGVAKKMTRKRYIKNQERVDQASRDIQTNEVLPKWWEF